MIKENKQPVVYVARRIFDMKHGLGCVGHFVSKGYLNSSKSTFDVDGKENTSYSVDVGDRRYIRDSKGYPIDMPELIPAEVGSDGYDICYDTKETFHRVFDNYADCYSYATSHNDEWKNKRLSKCKYGSEEYNLLKSVFDGAKKYGEKLERTYINEANDFLDRMSVANSDETPTL